MKKILLMFTLALCILFSACAFLYAYIYPYYIFKVTKIGLSYTGATTPEVEIPLSEVFDFQEGTSPAYYASDKVTYRGEIQNGTITGVWVYATDIYYYNADGTLATIAPYNAWLDCRTGFGESRTNLNIAVSEGERAKIIIDYTSSGYVDTKEAL